MFSQACVKDFPPCVARALVGHRLSPVVRVKPKFNFDTQNAPF